MARSSHTPLRGCRDARAVVHPTSESTSEGIHMKTIVIGGLLLAALPIHPAFALEGLKTYDNFSEPAIDGTRWLDAERSASIKNGALVLSHRTYGLATSDTGSFSTPFRTFFSTSSAITEIKAKITVNGLETNACP